MKRQILSVGSKICPLNVLTQIIKGEPMTDTYISQSDVLNLFWAMSFVVNRDTRLRHINGEFKDVSWDDIELALADALSRLEAGRNSGMEEIITAEHLRAFKSKISPETMQASAATTPVVYSGEVAVGGAPERRYRADAVEQVLMPYLDSVKFETLIYYFGRNAQPASKDAMLARKLRQLETAFENLEPLHPHVTQLSLRRVSPIREYATAVKAQLAVSNALPQLSNGENPPPYLRT